VKNNKLISFTTLGVFGAICEMNKDTKMPAAPAQHYSVCRVYIQLHKCTKEPEVLPKKSLKKKKKS
jgi:hypothetical protein